MAIESNERVVYLRHSFLISQESLLIVIIMSTKTCKHIVSVNRNFSLTTLTFEITIKKIITRYVLLTLNCMIYV